MKKFQHLLLAILLIGIFSSTAFSQCQTWNDSPQKEEAENAHVVYRPFLKGKQVADLEKISDADFAIAFDHWKKAYEIAPAADGKRASHFSDGRKLYQTLYKKEADAAKKKEHAATIMRLYDEQIECYKNTAFLLGRKGYDMFYMPEYGYSMETMKAFEGSMEEGGNGTEYIVFDPLSKIIAYFYKTGVLEKEKAIELSDVMDAIIDYNIENNERYAEYFKSTKVIVSSNYGEIETELFDCAYFQRKLVPQYRENKDDIDVIKYVYNKLKNEGCDPQQDIMKELEAKYESMAAEINAQLEIEKRQKFPDYDAKLLYEEGKFREAIARYREAIEIEEDLERQGEFYFAIAAIQFRKLDRYAEARTSARKAASLKSNWGRPYMLIGDMYAKSARSCGSDAYSRGLAILAALEKYRYAKSIDSGVKEEANKKIGIYSASKPPQDEAFMRGFTKGQKVKVECWIGETVKLDFQNP